MRRARGEVIGRAVLPTERGRGPRWMRRWWRRVLGYFVTRGRGADRVAVAPEPAPVEVHDDRPSETTRVVEPTGECVAVVEMGQLDVAWRIANVRT